MSDYYTEAMQSLGDSARAAATTGASQVQPQKDWMDAYGQQDQKSWSDYYEKYKGQFSGDQAKGYAAATQGQGNNNNVGMQYLMNMQQRQVDDRMNEYQDWMKNYWGQQQQSQQQLLEYLKQAGGKPAQSGEWWEDQRFQDMAGMYAQHHPEWINWARGENQSQFRTAVEETLRGFYNMTPEERDAAGARFGISGQQWMQDLLYLSKILGVNYQHQPPAPAPAPEPTPAPGPDVLPFDPAREREWRYPHPDPQDPFANNDRRNWMPAPGDPYTLPPQHPFGKQ